MENQNKKYLSVLGGKQAVWFNVKLKDGKKFLKWAKSLGCVWFNGEEIKEMETTKFFTIELNSLGVIGYVPNFCKVNPQFKDIERINFTTDIYKKFMTK